MAEDLDRAAPLQDPVTPQELAEVIAEFEQYRQRLVEDLTTAAQKAKLPKSKLMTRLEPELAEIDAVLANLRQQYTLLTNS